MIPTVTGPLRRHLAPKGRWDIETGSLPDEQIRLFYRPLPEFCLADFLVSTPEAADPETGAELIAQAKAHHAKACEEHWQKFREKAALSPLTGRVLSIGIRNTEKDLIWLAREPKDEAGCIAGALSYARQLHAEGGRLEGFNTDGFDTRFVYARARKLGLDVSFMRSGRGWSPMFYDQLSEWQLGQRQRFISLDKMGKFLGTQTRKNGSGADFAEKLARDPEEAMTYFKNDLVMTEELGDALIPSSVAAELAQFRAQEARKKTEEASRATDDHDFDDVPFDDDVVAGVPPLPPLSTVAPVLSR